MPDDLPERFWSKIKFGDGCWPWRGAKTPAGYGTFGVEGKTFYAHRLIYTVAVGPLLPPLQIDHLCRNRACQRPSHLEAVAPAENLRRGLKGVLLTHCKNGHPYNEANTYWRPDGYRNCRPCQLERNRKSRERTAHV